MYIFPKPKSKKAHGGIKVNKAKAKDAVSLKQLVLRETSYGLIFFWRTALRRYLSTQILLIIVGLTANYRIIKTTFGALSTHFNLIILITLI